MRARRRIEISKSRRSAYLALIRARALASFLVALKNFLRQPITLDQARKEVERRIALRAARFLTVVDRRVFRRPESPYAKLLKNAGCDFAELGAQIKRYGVEKTLERLAAEGVYLTPDEFKGKREVKRGQLRLLVEPEDLEAGESLPGLRMQTSGTTNAPRSYLIPIPALASRAFSLCVFYAAHDLFSHSGAVYDAVLPSNGGIRELLVCSGFGYRLDRWFARRVPSHHWLGARCSEALTYLVVMMGNAFGPGFPRPEFIESENVGPILDWFIQERRRGKPCLIRLTPSNAARIARAAWDKSVSLEGVKFRVGGEPFTEAKRDAIARVGAMAIPSYGFEAGVLGFACVHPADLDDLHVDLSRFALVERPEPLDYAHEIRPFLVTTLDEVSPQFYLNLDIGDHGAIVERRCGCPLEALGMPRHIQRIRSHEKFTSEGMNYFYADLLELLEKALPSEFGGGPGDYQLVEAEDSGGQTRLVLIVHPQVGRVQEESLLTRLHGALARGSRANEFQSRVWKDAGTVIVKREIPLASARGKILPLRFSRNS